nr:SMR family transporter [Marinobacter bryozoorum]
MHHAASSADAFGLINPEFTVKYWLFLAIAIFAEVLGTSALKDANGFTRLWPSVIVVVSYSVAFYFLSLSLKAIPVGIAYAIWAGLGVVLITLVGWLALGQKLDSAAVAGMGLIVAGVAVINLFSSAGGH